MNLIQSNEQIIHVVPLAELRQEWDALKDAICLFS
jgi:hypothetical protein